MKFLIGRQGNMATYLLERHARLIDNIVQWYQYPDFLLSTLLLDADV